MDEQRRDTLAAPTPAIHHTREFTRPHPLRDDAQPRQFVRHRVLDVPPSASAIVVVVERKRPHRMGRREHGVSTALPRVEARQQRVELEPCDAQITHRLADVLEDIDPVHGTVEAEVEDDIRRAQTARPKVGKQHLRHVPRHCRAHETRCRTVLLQHRILRPRGRAPRLTALVDAMPFDDKLAAARGPPR